MSIVYLFVSLNRKINCVHKYIISARYTSHMKLHLLFCFVFLLVCIVFGHIFRLSPQASLQHYVLFSVDNATHRACEIMVLHNNGMSLHNYVHQGIPPHVSRDTKWKVCHYKWNSSSNVFSYKCINHPWKSLHMRRASHEEHAPSGYYCHAKDRTYYMYQPYRHQSITCKTLTQTTVFFKPSKNPQVSNLPIYALTPKNNSFANIKLYKQSEWEQYQIKCTNTRHMHKWDIRLFIKKCNAFPHGLLVRFNTQNKQGVLQWKDRHHLMHVQGVRVRTHKHTHPR